MEELYCEVCEVDGQREKKKRKTPLRAKLSKRPKHDAKRAGTNHHRTTTSTGMTKKGTGQHQGDARSRPTGAGFQWHAAHTLPFPQFEIAAAPCCPRHSACALCVARGALTTLLETWSQLATYHARSATACSSIFVLVIGAVEIGQTPCPPQLKSWTDVI